MSEPCDGCGLPLGWPRRLILTSGGAAVLVRQFHPACAPPPAATLVVGEVRP